ncbi:MAG: flagellar brake protein [Clostridium sp.]|nr:flagellar brake protein [Clostridium sp.]MCM1397987.1 flagellar brake protein [Clostridium sp.]MCM1459377.1 flagellar brake protein [Bacteroides sp.]
MGIAVGNKIELVKLEQIIKNDKDRKVYVSKICDFVSSDTLQIAMPIYDGKIVPLPVDEKFSACFYTDQGLLQCNVLITSRYKSGNLFFLEVFMLGELAKLQRRDFYRYKCSMGAQIRVVTDSEYETGVPDDITITEDDLEWQPARFIDISGGGAKIVQKDHLEKNEIVKIRFELVIVDEILKFSLFARVLSSLLMDGRDLYEQRLEFMKIAKDDRDKIIKYIFESERVARAKGIGYK